MKKVRLISLCAVLAGVATALLAVGSASAAQFRAQGYPVNFTQQGLVVIKVPKGEISCYTNTLAAAESSASSTLTTTPTLTNCEAFGVEATASVNSCHFIFHSTNESAPFSGTMDISCDKAGDTIQIVPNGVKCSISIPAQSGLGGVEFQNKGSVGSRTQSITAALNITGLHYVGTGTGKEGTGCGILQSSLETTGPQENGTVGGSYTFTGKSLNEQQIGVYVGISQVEELPQFQAESYPAFIEGRNSGGVSFTTAMGTRPCTTLVLSGNTPAAASDLRLHPEFGGCTAFGITFAVETTGCDFVPYTVTKTSGAMSIVCNPGSVIKLKPYPGSKCETTIPAQSGINAVSFSNSGTGKSRTVSMGLNLSGISYTESVGCGKPGTYSDGAMSATVILSGYTSVGGVKNGVQGLWVS